MKILKRIFFGIVILIAFIFLSGLFIPNAYTVSSSINIKQPSITVFEYAKMLDNQKYFVHLNKRPWTSNKMQYDYFKSKAKLVLKGKYGHLNNPDKSKKMKLFYTIKVNDVGEIVDANFVSMDSENGFKGLEDDLDAEVKTFIKHYPDLYPGQLLNNKVYSLVRDYIEF